MKNLLKQKRRVDILAKQLDQKCMTLHVRKKALLHQIYRIIQPHSFPELIGLLSISAMGGFLLSRYTHLLSKRHFLKLYAIFKKIKGLGFLFI